MVDQTSKLSGDTAGDGWQPGHERIRNIARLQSFLNLEPGWDSYDAESVKPLPVMLAIIMQSAPSVVPLSNGGVQMEWHNSGWDVELEISPTGEVLLDYIAPAVPPADKPETDSRG